MLPDTRELVRLGADRHRAGRFHDAEQLYRQALAADPNCADAWHLLGMIANQAGEVADAVRQIGRALELNPGDPVYLNNLGTVFDEAGDPGRAEDCFRRAFAARPGYPAAHHNLGETLKSVGRLAEAMACYRRAVALDPRFGPAWNSLLMSLNYDPALSAADIAAEHRRWADTLPRPPARPHPNDPDPGRRLRVGYVSPDVRRHAVARFLEPLLEAHDRAGFEVHLYAEVPRGDEVTDRLKAHVAGFRLTVGRSAEEVAELVRADRIDILVDLAGHTRYNRLDVFPHRPAPVQATYIGYPNTTGLDAVGYRITDAVVDPPDRPVHGSEEAVRLAGSFACFRPPASAPPVADPPCLARGAVTFASHHPPVKLNDRVFAVWRRVLAAVPDSRLLIFRSGLTAGVADGYRAALTGPGVDPARVEVRAVKPEGDDYLRVYAEADAVLDCFPFTGHTMTCECLWMGVPVVTLRGDRPAGRLSASVLTAVGLPELIADSPDDYVRIAAGLAADPGRLRALRAGMRDRMRATVCDGPAYTRRLEAAYRELWRRWCDRAPARTDPARARELNARALEFARVGDRESALPLLEEARRHDPASATVLNNLGNCLKHVGRYDEAVAVYGEALRVAPDDPVPAGNLVEAYRLRGDFARCRAGYQKLTATAGPFDPNWSTYLLALNYDPTIDGATGAVEHFLWGRTVPVPPAWPSPNDPAPDRPLRVGYVSSELRKHPAARFLSAVLRHHDPARVRFYLYAEVPDPDPVTEQLRQRAAGWYVTAGRSADEVAARVRADGIDVLVDLVGHFAGGRQDVFARRPAPVQACWLSYPNTSGHPAVGYRLTDAVVEPPGPPPGPDEPVHLPGGFLGFDPPAVPFTPGPPPADAAGFVTFGCNHHAQKLHPGLFAVWKRVLDAVPGSRLLMFRSAYTPDLSAFLSRRLTEAGIDPARVRFLRPAGENDAYLETWNQVDIALDSFPYGGHTTTCECLWMGVPVVTLRGDRPVARVSASILTRLGLTDLIADTADDYVRIAAGLAADRDWLRRLRAELRGTFNATVGDGAAFTWSLEDAYRRLWRRWCADRTAAPAADPVTAGVAHLNAGRGAEAAACFEQAVAARPGDAVLHNHLGNALQVAGRADDAAAAYRRAAELDPALAVAHANLAQLLADAGDDAAAHAGFRAAAAVRPEPRIRVAGETVLPVVADSADHLAAARRRFADGLARLVADGVRLDPTREVVPTHFYLPYDGGDDRPLAERKARLAADRRAHTFPLRPNRGKRVRVGVLSRYLRDHTIGRLNAGLIAGIDRTRFEVVALPVGPADDPLARRIAAAADHVVPVPAAVPAALAVVADQRLDVLHYPDLGMDPLTYTLAFTRLAPVVTVGWGHPVTTGLPTVDVFLSADPAEPPGAEAHYTERLVRLPRLGVVYDRPADGPPPDRAAFGLPADATLYGCPQTLFKFHPAFDPVLADILRADPRGLLLLVDPADRRWKDRLLARWRRTLPDVLPRVWWFPPLPRPDFLALLRAADVMLDPFPFGGGNTTYEALAFGTPVVTLPTGFLRGRLTLAMYRQIGVTEAVASDPADYVRLAVALGTDPARRRELRGRLREAAGALYDDAAVVREVERCWLERHERPGRL